MTASDTNLLYDIAFWACETWADTKGSPPADTKGSPPLTRINIGNRMIDITAPVVQIQIDADGKRVWINVDGVCRLRAYAVKEIELVDERRKNGKNHLPGEDFPP